MALSTVIFDLDGTLIDSAPDLRTAANKLLEKYQRRAISLAETKKFVGNGAQKLVERAFKATGDSAAESDLIVLTQEFLAFYDGHEADDTQTYDAVIPTLEILKEKGFRLALCTNKPYAPTLNLMQALNLGGYFEFVIGGDQVSRKKPDAEMLNLALEQMGVSSQEAVMIGDSPNDIGAAKNAQLRSIAVSYGYRKVPVEELGADWVIDQMSDLPAVLDGIV
ncbi:MAG: phosphoglycolate phosphatase [Methylocystaceae bacterium]|nr:phosphoglycolate phosphatase [Methylocystaceae bacterium]